MSEGRQAPPAAGRVVTLLTDFGTAEPYAGILKGVILGIAPAACVVDLTHEVPAQNVVAGALLLSSAVPVFAPGTIHVAVVDPGVGSARRAVAVITRRGVLVGPDNGLLASAAEVLDPIEVRELTDTRYFRLPVSTTFHGRDIFASVAGHLAAGLNPAALGPPAGQLQPLALPKPEFAGGELRGEAVHVDHFGNLITNLPACMVKERVAEPRCVRVAGGEPVPFARTYTDVPPASTVALIGSSGFLEVAVRDGSAARVLRAAVGTVVVVGGAED